MFSASVVGGGVVFGGSGVGFGDFGGSGVGSGFGGSGVFAGVVSGAGGGGVAGDELVLG